jgi:hypothetical protein
LSGEGEATAGAKGVVSSSTETAVTWLAAGDCSVTQDACASTGTVVSALLLTPALAAAKEEEAAKEDEAAKEEEATKAAKLDETAVALAAPFIFLGSADGPPNSFPFWQSSQMQFSPHFNPAP